jgi:hypothetical protein
MCGLMIGLGAGVALREDLPDAGEDVSESVHASARLRQTGPRGDLAVEGGVTDCWG